jgi:FkbM family methyltransferase
MKLHQTNIYWYWKRKFRKANIRNDGYGQYGQDQVAYELLGKPQSGTFLDIGANDGVNFSNSLFFEKKGWSGICVEPHPVIFKILQKGRSCHLENACISDNDGTVNFLVVNGASNMLSGIDDFLDDRHRERIQSDIAINGGSTELIPIAALSPSSLLSKYGYKSIDFLSIDTEGCELEILKSFNLKKTAPRVISVENGTRSNSLFKYLTAQGYKLSQCVGCDEIYIHTSI